MKNSGDNQRGPVLFLEGSCIDDLRMTIYDCGLLISFAVFAALRETIPVPASGRLFVSIGVRLGMYGSLSDGRGQEAQERAGFLPERAHSRR